MNTHSDLLPRPVNIVKLKMVREKRLGYNTAITGVGNVIGLIKGIFKDSYREMVLVIGVDNANRPTIVHTVSVGSPNQSFVPISCVFKPLLLSNSVGFIIVHNHPGSNLTPSSADREITERLKAVGAQLEITMLDHVILNADGSDHYSFRTNGTM